MLKIRHGRESPTHMGARTLLEERGSHSGPARHETLEAPHNTTLKLNPESNTEKWPQLQKSFSPLFTAYEEADTTLQSRTVKQSNNQSAGSSRLPEAGKRTR